MLTRLELKSLASHTLDGADFVSLYLDLDPSRVKKDEWHLHFKSLVRAIPNTERSKVAPDLEKIERFLGDHPAGTRRGMAVISSHARDFWWVYHSALPFRSDLVIKHNPYIQPLVTQLDQYQRYLVAVVGGEEARLFIAAMGDLVEITDFYRPVPENSATREGGWGDMGTLRAQRRKDNSLRILFKDVATAMDGLMKREEIQRVLLGGTDHARGHFKEVLPDFIAHRVVGEFHVDHNAGVKEILERLLPTMKEVEFQFERKALKELFDRNGKEGGGIVGMPGVLNALQQGNVRKMFALTNLNASGMVCQKCGALTDIIEGPCPYCGGSMDPMPYMLDLVIQKALDQGVRIDMLDQAPELAKAGGIGALLRY